MSDPLKLTDIEIYSELFKRKKFDFITLREGHGKNLKQEEALQDLTGGIVKELMYGGAAGGAKSWTGTTWLIFMCLLYPETRWFIGRSSLKDIRESTLITFMKSAKRYTLRINDDFKINQQDYFIIFPNGSRIDLLDLEYYPSDPMFERLGSKEYTGGFLEECGQLHFNAFDVLKTRIGRQMNDKYSIKPILYLTCNPKKNWIYNYFYKPFTKGELKTHQKFIRALATDNPHRDSDYLEQLNSIKDVVQKQRLLLGNFEYDDDPNALIDYDKIQDIFTNDFVKGGEPVITCDVARYGRDSSQIVVWDGWRVKHIESYETSSTKLIEERITDLRRKHFVPTSNVIVDEDGVGGGVVDHLGCVGFVNNSSPVRELTEANHVIKPNYSNLKSQCYFRLSDRININGLYFPEKILSQEAKERLIQELEQVKQKDMDKDGKKAVIPKEEVKQLIGRSPDLSDVLMMREYFDLVPKRRYPTQR
jgi:phage terminase large subunit